MLLEFLPVAHVVHVQGYREHELLEALQQQRSEIVTSIEKVESVLEEPKKTTSEANVAQYLFRMVLRELLTLFERLVRAKCFSREFDNKQYLALLQATQTSADLKYVIRFNVCSQVLSYCLNRSIMLSISEALLPECVKSSWSSGRAQWREFLQAAQTNSQLALSVWILDLSLKSGRTGKLVCLFCRCIVAQGFRWELLISSRET